MNPDEWDDKLKEEIDRRAKRLDRLNAAWWFCAGVGCLLPGVCSFLTVGGMMLLRALGVLR